MSVLCMKCSIADNFIKVDKLYQLCISDAVYIVVILLSGLTAVNGIPTSLNQSGALQ